MGKTIYQYLYVFPRLYSPDLFAGIDKPIHYLDIQNNSRLVYFDNVDKAPYLYVLFYTKMDPVLVQKEAQWKGADTVGLSSIESVSKYRFVSGTIDTKKLYYYVSNTEANPAGLHLDKSFYDQRTNSSWYVYRN